MIHFAYFGSSTLSVHVLEELERVGLVPALVVTTPDKPAGRNLTLTANIVKTWAVSRNIPVLDPAKLDQQAIADLRKKTEELNIQVFVVASYGKIIPEEVLNIPAKKTLNIHPSLLPEYRGASPLQQAMLDDKKETGVTIIRLDREMDHGPIVAQQSTKLTDHFPEWPTYDVFEKMMAVEGAKLLAHILPDWVLGKITEVEQNHSQATYTKKTSKEDGLIEDFKSIEHMPPVDQYALFRKIQAYMTSPTTYFFVPAKSATPEKPAKNIRVKITAVSFKNDTLVIERVIPEGKKEISFADFRVSYLK